MADEFQMTVGQAHELEMAFRRNGWNAVEVKTLSVGNALASVREVILGRSEIKPLDHVINCDIDPFVPSGWGVEEHQKGGQLKWDPARVNLFLSGLQAQGKPIDGHKLREELKGKQVLNAIVLDYLLKYPYLIPEEWKQDDKGRTRYVFFWGTIYRGSDGSLYVRGLCRDGAGWCWLFSWLGSDWGARSPAALQASLPAEAVA